MNRRMLEDCEEFLFHFDRWEANLPEHLHDVCIAELNKLVFEAELAGWQFEPPVVLESLNPCAEISLGTSEQCNIGVFLPEWWADETLAQLHENMTHALALNIDKIILGKKP